MTDGCDWIETFGPAISGADGTILCPNAELATQWGIFSDEDKALIRRPRPLMEQKGAHVRAFLSPPRLSAAPRLTT
jgi:hypothetical protein